MSENKLNLETFYGLKSGMTRIFDENGNHVPVTVIKLIPNIVTQVKTADKEGYSAYQVGLCEKKEKLLTSANKGHLKKAGITLNLTKFAEVKSADVKTDTLGLELSVDSFLPGTYIDVTAISKGKGFAGVVKRYNFRGGPASHGSHFHRRVGSIGNRATPGRVFKNKKMPGHMGVETTTIQNLTIVELRSDTGYILIKGSVPGAKNGVVRVTRALKK
jgi:large subunit ribosomal protein L3